ncbi:unnamed protein product [Pseudo-nitzschia multistriata]|uniref:Aminotransferase class V domain-containing protein n=1 Tax=Pseudo-nitzschia multistriata TaxID=183589 RepID=A0A448YVU8_9STRA|nr:unnamed protein product [Pseudo-nitzschia multistriata]
MSHLKRLLGYKSIGSFHTEDVDVLMSQSSNVYEIPKLPFDQKLEPDKSDFLLDRKKWTFLNHGAFGASLRVGYDRAEQWRFHLERQPLRYFDRDLLPHLVYSARRLANFCHASRDHFTLIPNVTYGLNTILRGYSDIHKEKSHVILWDTSYGSLKKMAHEYCPERVTEIPVSNYFDRCWDDSLNDPSDVFEEALCDSVEKIKTENNNKQTENALLILDHTTSNTALNMPLEKLSRAAKEMNMLVMVDGAHGILAQDLHLNETELPDVDFYLGNGHKWLSCPRGIGFLYCPDASLRHSILRLPAVISHGIGQGFQSRFLWDGCRDYTAALSVPAVLDFWEQKQNKAKDSLNGVPFQTEINNRLQQAVKLLSRTWHPDEDWERSLLVPFALHSPMMALVRLPDRMQSSSSTSGDAKAVQDFLYKKLIEVPIKCVEGVLYVRISCHIYNEIDEYQRLAETLLRFPTSQL